MTSTIKYIGMDVHKESTSIAVRNSVGKIVMECVIETKASTIPQFLDGLRGDVHVTFEEGTWAAWLYDLIKPRVNKVVVCNPRKNALLKEGSKGDKIDAGKLSELLRLNHLEPVYHGENGIRTLKETGAQLSDHQQRSHAGHTMPPRTIQQSHRPRVSNRIMRCHSLIERMTVRLVRFRKRMASSQKDMEPQGRGGGSPRHTRRRSGTQGPRKTTRRSRVDVQSVGLTVERIFRHRTEGEIFLLTFPFIGSLRSGRLIDSTLRRASKAGAFHPLRI